MSHANHEAAVAVVVACSFQAKLLVVAVCETQRGQKKKKKERTGANPPVVSCHFLAKKTIKEEKKSVLECETPAPHLNCKLNWMQISS